MDIEKLANEIVEYLFSNGVGKRARRLVLELTDGRNGGGWGKEPMRDAIIDKIKAAKPAPESER